MQGRKISNDTWKKFPHVLAENAGSITAAAAQLGIDPRSVYYQIRRSPVFAGKVRETYDLTVVPIVEQQMFALAVKKQDYRAMRFILTNRDPRRWNTEFVLKAELEAELARELKNIKDSENRKKYVSKHLSLSELLFKHLYEHYLYGNGDDVADEIIIDTRPIKAHYESYREKREAELKAMRDKGE